MIPRKLFLSLLPLALAGCTSLTTPSEKLEPAQSASITVHADQPGPKISPTMWGAFFEDINFGADGGLYAEMVKNRGFEFPDPMMGWFKISPSMAKGDVTIETQNPYRESQTHYARIVSKADAPIGISNEGFRGMGVKAGEAYDFSAHIRTVPGKAAPDSRITVELVGNDGTTLASAHLLLKSNESNVWSKVTATLRAKETDAHARLAIFLNGPGTADFDFISLFPQKTWMNRPGGLRADMAQALADLHPGFLRFPGGCIVEGSDLTKRYQWKNTIGPVEDRKVLINRWNYEFKHRPTPDYYQSFGLGFFEFFQLCDDIGAQPLPIINCGMACQFNSGELCPPDELGPYIQDALDLIEFANGPVTSTWGASAAMGHPAPFNMKMMGVGNEQWGPQYLERLTLFTKAIKEKHPEIALVSDSGPSPDDDRFAYLWPKLQEFKVDGHPADIVDQHCYANPAWFLASSTRFDNYDRNGPKIFFGEYAAQSVAIVSTKNKNNLECALAEAAYMTGLERNADVVHMASYAPLFSNTDAWQWTPDLIWTDSLHAVPSVNYYVQQLFCMNKGDIVLPTTNTAAIREVLPAGRIGLGTLNASAEFKDVRMVRVEGGKNMVLNYDFSKGSSGWTRGDSWKTIDGVYQQSDPAASSSSFAGEKSWSDYTLTFKARRTSATGALNITVVDDNTPSDASRAQWILGAPVGSFTVADPAKPELILQTHFAEQDQLLAHTPGTLEKDRWYDFKISVQGSKIQCFIDGKLIHSATILDRRTPSLFTSSARDEKTGDTLLKIVNPQNHFTHAAIHLAGLKSISSTAQVTTLSGDPNAQDTLNQPPSATPKTTTLNGISPDFSYTLEPHSFTVIRIH